VTYRFFVTKNKSLNEIDLYYFTFLNPKMPFAALLFNFFKKRDDRAKCNCQSFAISGSESFEYWKDIQFWILNRDTITDP